MELTITDKIAVMELGPNVIGPNVIGPNVIGPKKSPYPTLCLNMIVKNESKILIRMFDAVIDIIDCYCICDTGSTDNTPDLITDYFLTKGIPGKIVHEPFKNFSHNRNVALWACKGMSDYVLLLDADMILKISEKFDKKVLTQDYYHIFQGNEAFYYQNVRIVRNNGLYAYVGVTHEYVNTPAGSRGGKVFDKKVIFIHDIGDGGAKSDKFKRDIRLLEKGLEDEPANTRYYFYLGNSYRDYGDGEKAMTTYLKLLNMNGWPQEKFCACLSIGDIYHEKGELVNAAKYWLKASEYDNERIEGVVKAALYYRLTGENVVVNILYNKYKGYKRGLAEGKLFVDQEKYWDVLEYQNSISAYYANDKESGYDCCKQILLNGLMGTELLQSTMDNMRFYKDFLVKDTTPEREKLFKKVDALLDTLLKDNTNKNKNKDKNKDEIWCLLNTNNVNPAEEQPLSLILPDKKETKLSLEEVYQELKHCRITGQHVKAMEMYTMIDKEDTRYQDYEWQLEYDFSVFAYYNGIRNINDQVVTIFNKCKDASIIASVLSNMKFYKDILTPQETLDFSHTLIHTINGVEYTFHSSSSCIIPNPNSCNGYILNVRFVNYLIDEAGCYHGCTPHIITLNKCIELTKEFQVIRETLLDIDYVDRRYIGVEDMRIFKDSTGDIKFIGSGYHQNNTIGIVQGMYNIKMNDRDRIVLKSEDIKPAFNINSTCEKNWVYVTYKGETRVIYSWYPLKIGICNNSGDLLDIIEEKPMPLFFNHVRGSTCGFTYTNEVKQMNEVYQSQVYQSQVWFVVHIVSHEAPRHYYHILVVFDEELSLKRYSAPFKFEEDSIEYCLGLVVEKERVIMTYSTWDRTSKIGIYNKKYIEGLLTYSYE
jgi:tetratricopeptide (TPR) repeat protein